MFLVICSNSQQVGLLLLLLNGTSDLSTRDLFYIKILSKIGAQKYFYLFMQNVLSKDVDKMAMIDAGTVHIRIYIHILRLKKYYMLEFSNDYLVILLKKCTV